MLPSQEYRPEPQDGFSNEDYALYMFTVQSFEEIEAEARPAEGDYEDPHFQVFLDKMEDRDRLLEEVPW